MRVKSIDGSNIFEFDDITNNMKQFLKVHHPSCGHCKAMEEDWKSLGDHTKNLHHNAGIVELHADILQNPRFRQKYSALVNKVQGYPSLMIVKQGGIPDQEYTGDRSYKDMLKFCHHHLFTNEVNKYHKETKKTKKSNKTKKKGGTKCNKRKNNKFIKRKHKSTKHRK